jgi:hypothetical protein
LVVVAIIALLVSILLPSLASAREQAKVAVCAANLSQVGKSLAYCFNDYKAYPRHDDGYEGHDYPGHNLIMATWLDVLVQRRYLGSLESGFCPKDAKPDLFNWSRGDGWGFAYPTPLGGGGGCDYSYGINMLMTTIKGKPSDSQFRLDQYPSSRVFVADAFWNWMHGFGSDGMRYGIWNAGNTAYNQLGWRHGSRNSPSAEVMFLDGSVRAVRLSLSDKYPNGKLRGLKTGDKFFWRPGEHTNIAGWAGENTLKIDGVSSFTSGFEYPYGARPPNELIPGYYTQHNKWAGSIVAHKGWTR